MVLTLWEQPRLPLLEPAMVCRCGEAMVKDEAAHLTEFPGDHLWLCLGCRSECWATAEGEVWYQPPGLRRW